MILGSVGFMFGFGGSALVSKTMGEGEPEKARKLFSLFVYSTAVCGVIIAVISFIFLRPLAALMGAEGEMLDNCVLYGRILLLSLPFYMLQFEFQSFFITAEKPQMGLVVTVVCGLAIMSNISMSIVSILYNFLLMRYAGENGIAAYFRD